MTNSATVTTGIDTDRFRTARTAVYAWRGGCIGRVAEIEYRLSRLLLMLIADPACPSKAETPHLIGGKFDRLRQLLQEDGPVRAAVPDGSAVLEAYALFDELRTYLAHAALELSETEHGVMLWTFRLLRFSGGAAVKSILVLTEAEAKSARQALLKAGRALVTMMDKVEAAVVNAYLRALPYTLPLAAAILPSAISKITVLTPAAARPRS